MRHVCVPVVVVVGILIVVVSVSGLTCVVSSVVDVGILAVRYKVCAVLVSARFASAVLGQWLGEWKEHCDVFVDSGLPSCLGTPRPWRGMSSLEATATVQGLYRPPLSLPQQDRPRPRRYACSECTRA